MKDNDVKEHVKDVLLNFNREHYARLQHYETQRSAISNLLVIIAAAILAFVTFDKALTLADLPLTVLLSVIGIFGAAFCAKYHERAARQFHRIQKTRKKLDQVLFEGKILDALKAEADEQHVEKFSLFNGGRLSWVKINRLWVVFHLFIAILGLILTILIRFV